MRRSRVGDGDPERCLCGPDIASCPMTLIASLTILSPSIPARP